MFVHGFPEAAFVWDDLLLHFSTPEHGGYRCVAPNLRGYEHSSAPMDVAQYRAKHLMQDLHALMALEAGSSQPLAALVAHDWGGAVAWGLAATQPQCMQRLCIINSPHPATFLRELQHSPTQQAASAYMNFLARPDAPALLAQDDFRRLWEFFEGMGATDGPHAWLTPELRQRYREMWSLGLHGPCHYYGASPLRPATDEHPNVRGLVLPDALCRVTVPTQVIWGLNDTALPATLLDGLDHWVSDLRVDKVADASHWLIHEQPRRVIELLEDFIKQ
jgi:pimeloyl-ACP methyl ester carboxylesterase